MEINPSSTGNPGQSIVWTTDDNDLQGSGQARYYTCAFCKRGFSNAQALGGHMNIHRRDRARLKQASDELSLDYITKSSAGVTTDHDDHRDQVSGDKSSSKTASGDKASSTMKRASYLRSVADDDVDATYRILSSEDVGEELLRLPLSLEMKMGDTFSSSGIEDKKMQVSHGSSDQSELVDLELRLGPEPRDDTPTKSTRDFL